MSEDTAHLLIRNISATHSVLIAAHAKSPVVSKKEGMAVAGGDAPDAGLHDESRLQDDRHLRAQAELSLHIRPTAVD